MIVEPSASTSNLITHSFRSTIGPVLAVSLAHPLATVLFSQGYFLINTLHKWGNDSREELTKLEQSCLGDSTKLALDCLLNGAWMMLHVLIKYKIQMGVCTACQDIEEPRFIRTQFAFTSFVQCLQQEIDPQYWTMLRINVFMTQFETCLLPISIFDLFSNCSYM